MAGFQVGAIVATLKLDKKGWDASVKGVEKQQKSMAGFAKKHGEAMKKMGRSMTIAGAAILAGIGTAVKAFAGFDKAMIESLAIMGNVSETLKEKMADAAKEMSTKSTFAAKELAEAYFFLASAGMDAEQSIAALPVVTKFAQAGAFDLADATDLLTDALTALGLSSKDPIENQKNMIMLSDALVKANTLANASVRQFSEALTNKAAAALRSVNKGLAEGVAVLAAFADRGVKGQVAGQRLTMMINGMVDAQQRNTEAWKSHGIALFDAEGEMRDFADIIEDFEGKLGDMTTEQKAATLAALGFNVKTKNSILTLLGASGAIREYKDGIKEAGGITEEVARKQLEAFSNKMTVVKNKITIATIEIGEKLAPTIEKMATVIGNVAKKISEWIEKHPKLTSVILKVVAGLGALMVILGPLLMILPGIIAAVGLVSASFLAAAAPITAIIALFGFTITKVIKLIKVMNGLKKARKEAELSADREAVGLARMEEKLREVTDAAGLTRAEMIQLKRKYDDNTAALLHAIKTGKEGKELQEAMTVTAKNLTEEIEDQAGAIEDDTEAIEEQSGALEEVLEKEKDWTDFLKSIGIKTIEEKTKRTEFLEDVLNDLKIQLKDNIISLKAYGIAVKKAKDEINGFSEEVINTAVPASRDLSAAFETATTKIEKDFDDFGETVETTFVEVKNYTDQLIDGMGNAFGSFVGNMLTKGTSLKDNLKGLWRDIKNSFIGMIADMAKDWAIGFVKKIITGALTANKAIEKSDKVFQSMGKSVAGIGEGIGKLISSLAKGIGTAIETIAKSIANAAKSLAAAAPQLLIVGAVALALFAGFKAIQSLFGGGGGKAQDKATEMLQDIRNKTFDIFNGAQWMWKVIIGEQQARLGDHSQKLNWIVDQNKEMISIQSRSMTLLEKISVFTALTASALKNMPTAATGGYFPNETIVKVSEKAPEAIGTIPQLQNAFGGGGAGGKDVRVSVELNNTFNIQTLDPMTMRDVVREQIEPQLIESFSTKGRGLTAMKEALGLAT